MDDIILIGNNVQGIVYLKVHMNNIFNIKDFGKLSFFLVIEVGYIPSGITLIPKKFTLELIKEAGIINGKTIVTLFPLHFKLKSYDEECIQIQMYTDA